MVEFPQFSHDFKVQEKIRKKILKEQIDIGKLKSSLDRLKRIRKLPKLTYSAL